MFSTENDVYLDGEVPSAATRLHVSAGGYVDGKVPVCPAGGGFVFYVPESKLKLFPVEFKEPLKPMRFEIEDTPLSTKGWTDGSRWNGWSCPLVEGEEMRRVMGVILEWSKADGYKDARLVETATDCDVMDGDQHLEGACLSKRVGPEGQPLWDLGGSFCWTVVEEG